MLHVENTFGAPLTMGVSLAIVYIQNLEIVLATKWLCSHVSVSLSM